MAFNAEVLCADALMPGDFRVSYRTSFLPFGVFRIDDMEQSALWHMHQAQAAKQFAATMPDDPLVLPSDEPGTRPEEKPQQLRLF